MAAYEVLLLNTAIPQIQAAQSGDTYVVPRDIAFSAALTLSAGTANGVPYLNGSKVLTTGSALTFDGTNFGLQSATTAYAGSRNGATFRATSANGFEFILQSTNATVGTSTGFATAVTGNDVYFVNRLDGFYSWITGGSGNTEVMRLTSTGLGIGANNPAYKLDVQTSAGRFQVQNYGAGSVLLNSDGAMAYKAATTGHQFFNASSQAMTLHASGGLSVGNTSDPGAGSVNVGVGAANSNNYILRISAGTSGLSRIIAADTSDSGYIDYDHTVDAWQFYTASTERARITSGGEFLVGDTTTATTSGPGFKVLTPVSGHWDPAVVTSGNSASYSCWDIYSTNAGAYRFYVTTTGVINATSTTISAISDQRLKENIRDLDVGLNAVLALKPRKFDWKAGKGKDIKGDRGWIAQEFEQVFPDMIDEWKDPAPEGEEPYKAVRADLIPVLVKAIQEQQAMIDELKAKVAAMGA